MSDANAEPETPQLTAEELQRLRENRCSHCGGTHARACPRVRRMAWHLNGNLAEVEFWPDGRWPDEHIVWPEQLAEQQDEPAGDAGE